ncbi:MAG: HD domain-containing protein [Bacteroidota bacterium]|nr:HD domain-containing protein [Bacteroidota bacterium]
MDRLKQHFKDNKIFELISKLSEEINISAYVVGGYVRDILLQRKSKDIDIVVVGDGVGFAKEFAKKIKRTSKLSVFKNFGTANIQFDNYEIEFVGARKESYRNNSRKPIVNKGTLNDDLNRRDFTINTLAVNLNKNSFGELIDKFNGVNDLKNKIIKTPLEPNVTFSDDPLRMLRAIRFASQLNFEITPETFESIKNNSERISIISEERISEELNKILLSTKPSKGFYLLDKANLLNIFFPELIELKGTETVENKSHKDNFSHTLQVLDNVAESSDNLWLRWTALLHDIGKPRTKKFVKGIGWTFYSHDIVGSKMVTGIFRRFRLPMNEKMRFVKKLVWLHLRPAFLTNDDVTDSAIRRLIVDAGNDIDNLLILCKADVTSKNQAKVKMFQKRFEILAEKIAEVEEKDKLRNWKNPITGDIIMKTLNIKPSKEIGIIKERIKEAILEGNIRNDYDEAFALLQEIGKERMEEK